MSQEIKKLVKIGKQWSLEEVAISGIGLPYKKDCGNDERANNISQQEPLGLLYFMIPFCSFLEAWKPCNTQSSTCTQFKC